jgi:hypothetical protein
LGKNTRQIFFLCVFGKILLKQKNICFNKKNDYCTFIFLKKKQKLNYGCIKKTNFRWQFCYFFFLAVKKLLFFPF